MLCKSCLILWYKPCYIPCYKPWYKPWYKPCYNHDMRTNSPILFYSLDVTAHYLRKIMFVFFSASTLNRNFDFETSFVQCFFFLLLLLFNMRMCDRMQCTKVFVIMHNKIAWLLYIHWLMDFKDDYIKPVWI